VAKRYEAVPHTADVAFIAYGDTLEEVFENAAFAMFDMVFDLSGASGRHTRPVVADGDTPEELQMRGEPFTLRVGEVGDDGVLVPSPPLATLPGSSEFSSLLAWDTWGFLIADLDEGGSPSLSLLAPDGSPVWNRASPHPRLGIQGLQVAATGDILLVDLLDRTGGDIEIALTNVSGAEPKVLDWGLSTGIVRLAPDGQRVSYWSGDGRGAEVAQPPRLFVGGRDQTKLVEAMARQVSTVRTAVEDLGADLPVAVMPVICFVDGEWDLFSGPFQIGDVHVTGPRGLVKHTMRPGALEAHERLVLGHHLASRLPEA